MFAAEGILVPFRVRHLVFYRILYEKIDKYFKKIDEKIDNTWCIAICQLFLNSFGNCPHNARSAAVTPYSTELMEEKENPACICLVISNGKGTFFVCPIFVLNNEDRYTTIIIKICEGKNQQNKLGNNI
jgi:hypothetical protein